MDSFTEPRALEKGRAGREQQQLLGLDSAIGLVVANMIGTGVFTTSGFLLADLHSRGAVLAVWAAGGIVAALGALCYGALARHIPESGGEYLFLSRTLHPAAGYVAGWISLLVGFSAPLAAAAFGFGAYTRSWFGGLAPQVSGSILILIFSAIHAGHVRGGARIQNWAVLLKVLLIVGFIGFGLTRGHAPAEVRGSAPAVSAFAVSLVWVSFSYSGWNAAVYMSSEIREPERTLPKALWIGTVLVTVIYLGLNLVFLFSAPVSELAGQLEVGRIAARALGGPMLMEAVTAVIALGLITAVSAMLMAGPRVYSRMAMDGYLPGRFAVEKGPPRWAIALQAALALAMLWSATYDRLLTYIGSTLSLSTGATVVGLILLRRKEGASLRVPGWPWVPVLFLTAVLWMTAFAAARRPLESLLGVGTLALAWIVWRVAYKEKVPVSYRRDEPGR